MNKNKKQRDYQREYRKNMTDEQKQKLKDYLREYHKKHYAAKKLNNEIMQHDDNDNDNKIIKAR